MSENTTSTASLNIQKPNELMLVNGDFLAKQFREYQEIFAKWYGEETMDTPRGKGIPVSLDPLFMRRKLCKLFWCGDDSPILVLFQQKAELDFFDPEPEQAFKIVLCSGTIEEEMRKVIDSYPEIRRIVFVGDGEDSRNLENELMDRHKITFSICSFEEERRIRMEEVSPAEEYFEEETDILNKDPLLCKLEWKFAGKKSATIAWIMGFIYEFTSYWHEYCQYYD